VSTIELRSDNAAGVAPEILAAVAAANAGSALAYGADPVTDRLEAVVREVFEHPGARVFPVTSGTAANALSLSSMCPPWGAVLCHDTAHILNTEAAATSMMGGGLLMRGVAGADFRMHPDTLAAAFAATRWGDNHHSQPRVLSFTQPTDMGTIYSVAEIAALTAMAREHGLRSHLDGARLANAIVALGCTPAELTWRAGVDVVSMGATKNGALSAEAIVCFDDGVADELVYRTKRAGHVTSKMRFQSAQLDRLPHRRPVAPARGRRQPADGPVGSRPARARRRVPEPTRRQHALRRGRRRGGDGARTVGPALLPHPSGRDPARDELADHRRRGRPHARSRRRRARLSAPVTRRAVARAHASARASSSPVAASPAVRPGARQVDRRVRRGDRLRGDLRALLAALATDGRNSSDGGALGA
jgi:threonine aldolase